MRNEKGIAAIKLIIIIISILVAGGVITFFAVKGRDTYIETTKDSQIKNGNAKLINTASQKIEIISNTCYKITDENDNTIIMNNRGKSVSIGKATCEYLGDGYIVYDNKSEKKIIVYDINKGKEIYSYDGENGFFQIRTSKTCYKNGIFYYSDYADGKNITIAYDLINKKELWRVDGYIVDRDNCLQQEFIRLAEDEILTVDEKRYILPSVLVDYDGKTILSGNTEEYKIYTTKTNYYIKYKEKENIEVYDLKNNLVSQLSLKEDEKYRYSLKKVFDNGMYIIFCYDKNGQDSRYDLYDINSKAVLNKRKYITVARESLLKEEVNSTNTIVVNVNDGGISKKVLISNNKILDTCSDYYQKNTPIFSSNINDINHYLLLSEKYKTIQKIVNLDTSKIIDNPIPTLKGDFYEAPNGEYIILEGENTHYVYDNEFNKKYESENSLRPVNDKFVLEEVDNVLNMVNLESGQKNELKVQGKYYGHTTNALITVEGNNYYLYAFN